MTSIANRRTKSGLMALLAAMAVILALSVPAFAQSTLNGYGDQGDKAQGQVQGVTEDSGTSPTTKPGNSNNGTGADNGTVAATKGGTLPFTGFELGIMLAIGGSLLVVGVGLRRVARPPTA